MLIFLENVKLFYIFNLNKCRVKKTMLFKDKSLVYIKMLGIKIQLPPFCIINLHIIIVRKSFKNKNVKIGSMSCILIDIKL